jgi:uncharacterized membrane protein
MSAMERVIEAALTLGLVLGGGFLVIGLVMDSEPVLRWGIVIVMLTPMARVIVVTTGLLYRRDWTFGLVSFFVLSVLVVAALQGYPAR